MKNGRFLKRTTSRKKLYTILAAIVCIEFLLLAAFLIFEAGLRAGESNQHFLQSVNATVQEMVVKPKETSAISPKPTVAPTIIPATTGATEPSTKVLNAPPPTETSAPVGQNGTVLRSAGELNIRSGAGTNYDVVGRLNGGDSVTIYDQKSQNGMRWGNIGYGWVCMDYIVFGIDTSTAPTTSSEDEFYRINPSLGICQADYIGMWVGGNQNTWYMEITQSGNGVSIYVETPYNSSVKTVWKINGMFNEHLAIEYMNGVCTSYNNGATNTRYANGEGVIVLRDNTMSWHEAMEGSGDFMTFTRAGAHTPNPPYSDDSSSSTISGVNQQPSTSTPASTSGGNGVTRIRYTSKDYSDFALRECKIELGGGSSVKIVDSHGSPDYDYTNIWITGQGTMGEKKFFFTMHADGSSGKLILTKLDRISFVN